MKKNDANNGLLFLVVSVVIALGCWFFGFSKMNEKSAELDTKIAALDTTITQRTEYKNNSDKYQQDTKKYNESKEVYLEQFPSDVCSEDVFALVRNINALDDGTDEDNAISITGGKIGDAEEVYSTESSKIVGYKEEITLDFEYSTYEGIKNMIDYINSYENRCNVVSYTASMDTTKVVADDDAIGIAGTLTGDLTFNMYFLSGTDKEYKAPEVEEDYTFGVENPFTSDLSVIELEIKDNKKDKTTNKDTKK